MKVKKEEQSRAIEGSRLRVVLSFLLILSFFILLAGALSSRLSQEREVGRNVAHSEDVPPMVTFANVALGGFSGVIADILWVRMSRLQEQGRFLELMQLAEWITTLDPRNGEVWAYHAWNLTYNVSVMMTRPEDRWRWVRSGIELLRDKGLRYNPDDARVYRELAWFFQHKLGMHMDHAAPYYRKQWAAEIAPFLGEDGSVAGVSEQQCMGLQEKFKMDAATMLAFEERFGTMDWRMPLASAVYWGMAGSDVADAREKLACRRMVYQSLVLMIRDENCVNLVEGTLAYLEEAIAEHQFRGVEVAYGWLLLDGVRIDYAAGREDNAREKYARAAVILREMEEFPETFEKVIRKEAE